MNDFGMIFVPIRSSLYAILLFREYYKNSSLLSTLDVFSKGLIIKRNTPFPFPFIKVFRPLFNYGDERDNRGPLCWIG